MTVEIMAAGVGALSAAWVRETTRPQTGFIYWRPACSDDQQIDAIQCKSINGWVLLYGCTACPWFCFSAGAILAVELPASFDAQRSLPLSTAVPCLVSREQEHINFRREWAHWQHYSITILHRVKTRWRPG